MMSITSQYVAAFLMVLVCQDDLTVNGWPFRNKDPNVPAFCNRLACPNYSLISKTEDYEVREYAPSTWVSTNMSCVDEYTFSDKKRPMFWKLFNYIRGSNERSEKIDMTAPVTMAFDLGSDVACQFNITMSFYIAESVQPPPPTESDKVYIAETRAMKVYVRSFGGYASYDINLNELVAMTQALDRDGQKYNAGQYYTAGYDAPYKFWNRHNEVWMLADE